MTIKTIQLLAFSLLVFFVMGCSEKNAAMGEQPVPEIENKQDFSISAAEIANIYYVEYALSDEAEKATANWQKFQELSTQIEALKKGDFSFFTEDKDIIQGFLTDLVNETPESLDEPSIKVRLTSLSTAIYILEGGFRFDKRDKKQLLSYTKGLLTAHTNLIFQINKKLEKEGQNVVRPRSNL